MCTTCGESGHVMLPEPEPGPEKARRSESASAPSLRAQGWVREVRTVRLQRELLLANNRTASKTRRLLAEIGVTMLNVIGAPGSGKTALLEATVRRHRDRGAGAEPVVLSGDQTSDLDARTLEAAGGRVLSLITGAGCHLDASMIAEGLSAIAPKPGSVVLVENVGNLVCPALFDLGERAKVVVMSVTEGEDKPLKYSHVFHAADLFVLTKVDLLPHVAFDQERCFANVRKVNPRLEILPATTATTDGLDAWCDWIGRKQAE